MSAAAKNAPTEVWFRWNTKVGVWEWSFDPPYKRDELRFTRLVRVDADVACLSKDNELLSKDNERLCAANKSLVSALSAGARAENKRLREALRDIESASTAAGSSWFSTSWVVVAGELRRIAREALAPKRAKKVKR